MYKKLDSTTTLIQSTTTEAPQRHMYYTAFQTAQQAHPTCAGRSRQAGAERGSRFGASLRKEKAEGECQSSDASGRSEDGGLSARGRSRRTRLRAFPGCQECCGVEGRSLGEKKTTGFHGAQAARSSSCRLSDGVTLLRPSPNCFRTGSEHKLNLLLRHSTVTAFHRPKTANGCPVLRRHGSRQT